MPCLLIFLVPLVASLMFVLIMRKRGMEKYALDSFFTSKEFGVSLFGAMALAFSFFLYYAAVLGDSYSSALYHTELGTSQGITNSIIAMYVCSTVFPVIALTGNIRKIDDKLFGIFYTLAQVIAAYSFLIVAFSVYILIDYGSDLLTLCSRISWTLK